MSEPAHLQSLHRSADADMARFMAWRLKFKRALDTVDLTLVPPIWRDYVRVYQNAWQTATRNRNPDPRSVARAAVRSWLLGRPS